MPLVVTAEERPDLWHRVGMSFRGLWPGYNHHGDFTSTSIFSRVPRFAAPDVERRAEELIGPS